MLLLKSFLMRSLLDWAIVYVPNFPSRNLVDQICFKYFQKKKMKENGKHSFKENFCYL